MEGGSEEDNKEESEYDEEESGSDSEKVDSVKSLEWVKPVINIKRLLEEDVTDVHESL